MPYSSNNNAVLFDGCNNLQNLTVHLEVGSPIYTVDGSGWTLQLNCFVPPGHFCQTSQVTSLQYVVYMWEGILQYEVQYWAIGAFLPWPDGYSPQPNTTPWLPCWGSDFYTTTFATGLTGDALPGGSVVQIALATDSNGGVTEVVFTYIDPIGNRQVGLFKLPVMHPICCFEVNLVGVSEPPHNGVATFAGPAPDALLRYSVSVGELALSSGGSMCGVAFGPTGETSNMGYSDITDSPGAVVTQTLQATPPSITASTLRFAPQPIGTSSAPQLLTVAVGLGVTVTGITLMTVYDGPQFGCLPAPGTSQFDQQNGRLEIMVWSQPTVVGPRNATLQIAHSGEGSPLLVNLYGMGEAIAVPQLVVSTQSLFFTTKKVTNHTVTLSNIGTAPLTINSIAVAGPSGFTFGTSCGVGANGSAINPGGQCTVTVAYHGVVSAEATLVITHNAASSPATIHLDATVGKGNSGGRRSGRLTHQPA